MTAKAIAQQYKLLTPEERFRLILAAGGRGDDAEHERLVQASDRIHLSMPDYSPYANAIQDVSLMIFIELLEESARYFQALALADQEDTLASGNPEDAESDMGDGYGSFNPASDESEGEAGESDLCWANERSFRTALASGYVLRTKTEGWKQFCDRWSIPHFLLWQPLPGFARFQSALKLTDQVAFSAEGFLRWLNEVRPAGDPLVTEVPITAARTADGIEEFFRYRIDFWGGRSRSG